MQAAEFIIIREKRNNLDKTYFSLVKKDGNYDLSQHSYVGSKCVGSNVCEEWVHKDDFDYYSKLSQANKYDSLKKRNMK